MITVNQIGYQTKGKKHATAMGAASYQLFREDGEKILEGSLQPVPDAGSGAEAACIDFSEVTAPGNYYFVDDKGEKSCTFPICDTPYAQAFPDAARMFYFQRCGMELTEEYAGKYAHKACHLGEAVYLDDPSRKRELSGGWHDAGDFGRYVTAAAVALGHLLYSWQLTPGPHAQELHIPETGNGTPDLLNECRYELDWMLKMQDEDGGVHHKATSRGFVGFIMPEEDPEQVVITPVSSLATADLAAITALAARIYEPYDRAYAESLKRAALSAAEWLKAHPDFLFHNPEEVKTGTYEDLCDADERLWAAAELYLLTKEEEMIGVMRQILEIRVDMTALGWADVGGFAALAVLLADAGVFPEDLSARFRGALVDEAERLLRVASESPFELTLRPFEVRWGSNMDVLTNAMLLAVAHHLTGETRYLDAAGYQVDYIFGRNAMDTSYVTGHGERAFRDPHNRPTVADGIEAPIPGFVSGGPNARPCDEAANPRTLAGAAPLKCYVDNWKSYSTNEITIYWNSPLVFVLAYLTAAGR